MRNDLHCLIIDFLNFPPLPELMQGAGIAVLTLLVSFAIGIFIHHLGDGERKGNFLDLHIALDYVWQFKLSVILLLIIVVSPFFMSIHGEFFKSLIFIVWAIALAELLDILFRLYEWVKGDKDDFRRKYLSDFPKTSRDSIVSWADFWSMDRNSKTRFTESEFFVPFSKQIDLLLKSENETDWQTLLKLLDGFIAGIENRNKTFLLIFPEYFPKVLEWHYVLWRRQYSKFAKGALNKNEKADIYTFEVDELIDRLIKFETEEALSRHPGNEYSYFKHLESHMEKYRNEQIVGDKHTYVYIEHIPIYEDWFELIPKSTASYDIWGHYFPSSWKVTIQNLQQNKISHIWYNRFIEWSRSRLWKDDDAWDKDLEEVSRELFPSVDPIIWAKIYTFVLRPWSGSRVKSLIEKRVNFGYAGRVMSGWGDDLEENFAKEYKEQLQATIDIAMYLFGRIFTVGNLDTWISELNELQYSEDSENITSKQSLLAIFVALREKAVLKNKKLS